MYRISYHLGKRTDFFFSISCTTASKQRFRPKELIRKSCITISLPFLIMRLDTHVRCPPVIIIKFLQCEVNLGLPLRSEGSGDSWLTKKVLAVHMFCRLFLSYWFATSRSGRDRTTGIQLSASRVLCFMSCSLSRFDGLTPACRAHLPVNLTCPPKVLSLDFSFTAHFLFRKLNFYCVFCGYQASKGLS